MGSGQHGGFGNTKGRQQLHINASTDDKQLSINDYAAINSNAVSQYSNMIGNIISKKINIKEELYSEMQNKGILQDISDCFFISYEYEDNSKGLIQSSKIRLNFNNKTIELGIIKKSKYNISSLNFKDANIRTEFIPSKGAETNMYMVNSFVEQIKTISDTILINNYRLRIDIGICIITKNGSFTFCLACPTDNFICILNNLSCNSVLTMEELKAYLKTIDVTNVSITREEKNIDIKK